MAIERQYELWRHIDGENDPEVVFKGSQTDVRKKIQKLSEDYAKENNVDLWPKSQPFYLKFPAPEGAVFWAGVVLPPNSTIPTVIWYSIGVEDYYEFIRQTHRTLTNIRFWLQTAKGLKSKVLPDTLMNSVARTISEIDLLLMGESRTDEEKIEEAELLPKKTDQEKLLTNKNFEEDRVVKMSKKHSKPLE